MKGQGFFTFGCWLLRKSPPWFRGWGVQSLAALAILVTGIVPVTIKTLGESLRNQWIAAGLLTFLAFVIFYLNASESRLKELEKRDAEKQAQDAIAELWTIIRRNHDDATGNIQRLLTEIDERQRRGSTPTQFAERLAALQGALLRHVVTVISLVRAQPLGIVSANWVTEEPGEGDERKFMVRVFDRDQVARPLGRSHLIAPGIPGASEAFVRGDICLISDTNAAEFTKHFPDSRPYRTILSIPVRVRTGETIGVVNVDCQIPNTIQLEDAYLVNDTAYLIGLCETLKAGET